MGDALQFIGTAINQKAVTNPFRGQISACGKTHYLGSYSEEREAALAYDNAAYWLGQEGDAKRPLNFPGDYEADPLPGPTENTRRVLLFRRASVSQKLEATPQSAVKELKKQLLELARQIQLARLAVAKLEKLL